MDRSALDERNGETAANVHETIATAHGRGGAGHAGPLWSGLAQHSGRPCTGLTVPAIIPFLVAVLPVLLET